MANAPEGRTYIIKSQVVDPDILSGKKRCHEPYYPGYSAADYIDIETPYVVPNGKWVCSRPAGHAQLVGVDQSEVEGVVLDSRFGGMHRFYSMLYVCDRPFGFVRKDMPEGQSRIDGSNAYRHYLVYARQIHKGELGFGVPIPRPEYTRVLEGRREYGWVRLEHLGELATGYRVQDWIDLVLGYWPFSGHLRYENYQVAGTLVDVIMADNLNVSEDDEDVVALTPAEFVLRAGACASDIWIRRGFAFTILRLLALGVQPRVTQNA